MFEFEVEGMTCQNCVKHITQAVQENDSGTQVKVDLARHTVRVSHTEQSPDALTAQIEAAGYPVLNMKEVAA